MLNFIKSKFKVKKKGRNLETDALPDSSRPIISDNSNHGHPTPPIVIHGNSSDPSLEIGHTINHSNNSTQGIITGYNTTSGINGSLVNGPYNDTTLATPRLSPSISTKHLGSAHSIVINNASGFHIGDAINFTLGDGATVNYTSPSLGISSIGKSLSKKSPKKEEDVNLEELNEVVNERELRIIAQNISNDWKAFGRALTLTETDIDTIESNNNGSSFQASTAMLCHFMKLYPDSSVGFLVSLLNESGYFNAVRQLSSLRS